MDSLPQNSDELYLPVEYTSIEEILRNKRSNNLLGDQSVHEQETDNHASRLSTVSTLYQVLQAKHRNKEESPLQVNEDHGNAAILNKNYGAAGSGLEIEMNPGMETWIIFKISAMAKIDRDTNIRPIKVASTKEPLNMKTHH